MLLKQVIQYLLFIGNSYNSKSEEDKKEQYELVNKAIKLMQLVGNVYREENLDNSCCGNVYHLGFNNAGEFSFFDIDSEILDMTLPFSESGRSFTLLHGFVLSQEKAFKLRNFKFNFFKKYYENFSDKKDKERLENYNQKDMENFKIFAELCLEFMTEKEFEHILNVFYLILLTNQVTILKSNGFPLGK